MKTKVLPPAKKVAPPRPTTTAVATTDLSASFTAARAHAAVIISGARATVAGAVAFGLELIHVRQRLGYTHGGDATQRPTVPWKELVAAETGFSYVRCQDFIKTAEAVKAHYLGSRKKEAEPVRAIVKDPPSVWTDDDYQEFADHLGEAFDATTFAALMGDLKLLKAPAQRDGKDTQPGSKLPAIDPAFAVVLAAHDCIAEPILGLSMAAANKEAFTRHLFELPMEDLEADPAHGHPAITGLRTLSTVLAAALDEIALAIKNRRS